MNPDHFNYRIGRHDAGKGTEYYRVHECFYDAHGEMILWGQSNPHGETAEALIADLRQMLSDCQNAPVFDVPAEE